MDFLLLRFTSPHLCYSRLVSRFVKLEIFNAFQDDVTSSDHSGIQSHEQHTPQKQKRNEMPKDKAIRSRLTTTTLNTKSIAIVLAS